MIDATQVILNQATPQANVGFHVTRPSTVASDLLVTGKVFATANSQRYTINATFCGRSAAATTGVITFNALLGYPAAKATCETACGDSAAHMCSSEEIQRSLQLGIIAATGVQENLWYSTAAYSYGTSGSGSSSYLHDDCRGWTSTSTGLFGSTIQLTAAGVVSPNHVSCNSTTTRIACCL